MAGQRRPMPTSKGVLYLLGTPAVAGCVMDCLKADGAAGSRLFPARVHHIGFARCHRCPGLRRQAMRMVPAHRCGTRTGAPSPRLTCVKPAQLTVPVNEQFSMLARVLDPASATGMLTQVSSVYQQVQGPPGRRVGDSFGSGEGNPDYPGELLQIRYPGRYGRGHNPPPCRAGLIRRVTGRSIRISSALPCSLPPKTAMRW